MHPLKFFSPSIVFVILIVFHFPLNALELPNSQSATPLFPATSPSTPNNEFLPAEEAFPFTISHNTTDQTITITWKITEGYYLYKKHIKLESPDAAFSFIQTLPDGVIVNDPEYGDVEVYRSEFSLVAHYDKPLTSRIDLSLQFQGCAEAGLCYPPQTKTISLEATGENNQREPTISSPDNSPNNPFHEILGESSFPKTILLFFLAGIGLTFTPCVLPMIPILSSIIVGQKERQSRTNAFLLSLVYVLGMSITYASIGTVMGYFGASFNIQAYMQTPWVLIISAIVFVTLSLSMFGFYELALPRSLHDKLHHISQKQRGGSYIGVALMGIISSLIVSPCVSAPLSGALIYISTTGDPTVGGSALLALGLGMGVPLLIIGTTEGQLLPKAGPWMHGIKSAFGVLLLAVAIYLLARLLAGPIVLLLWAMLCIGSAVALGALDFSPKQGLAQFWKAMGFVLLIYGVILLVGAGSGQSNPLNPLGNLFNRESSTSIITKTIFQRTSSVEILNQQLAQANGKPSIVDIYADWCISCKIIEHEVFQDKLVQDKLSGFNLYQLDITENRSEYFQFLKKYQLFGPPSLLFFDKEGNIVNSLTLQGEFTLDVFLAHLSKVSRTLSP